MRAGGTKPPSKIRFFKNTTLPYSFVQYSIDCFILSNTLFFPPT